MFQMVLKIKKLVPEAILPSYANPGDAGMDIYSNETTMLNPGDRKTISTGISMAIPSGHVGLLWDKSGISANYGLKILGGVIDSSYRGEIKIIIHNLSNKPYLVEKGKKLAQLLVQQVEQKQITEVEELDRTQRDGGGFGSTGLD